MKIQRILIIIIAVILLSACGSKVKNETSEVHANVDMTFAEDTKRVLQELDGVVENEEEPSEKVNEITERYLDKYNATEKTDEEENIYMHTKNLIISTDGTDYLESDKESYRKIRDAVLSLIKTGKI